MSRLYLASTITLGILAGMIAGVVLAAMVALGELNLGVAITITVVINLVLFLISPWLTDLSLRWINKVAWLDDATLASRHPKLHTLIQDVAREHGFKAPSVGIIPDRNPTAFTYGILRSNARIVLTDGIFEFLNEEEARAVTAHELGHIVHRDFLVMTVAGVLVQIMYQIYAALSRGGGSDDKSAHVRIAVAIVAFVFYQIGIYVLLYLSRTREYLADAFAAEHVDARHLSNALVKIAYGIAEATDSEATQSLLASTRHLGVVDVKGARHLGLVAENAGLDPKTIANSMLFDVYNPWAKWVELSSTHPLTGKRIQHMAAIAEEKRQAFPDIDIPAAARRAGVDQAKLSARFRSEIMVLLAPFAMILLFVVLGGLPGLLLAPAAGAAVWLATVKWRYPTENPKNVTVAELMGDYAASPIRGRPVRLVGQPIGRVDPGSVVGEDLIFADKTGRIIADFRSMLGPIGDLWAGWRRVAKHIGEPGELIGWFRRSTGGYVIQRALTTTKGTINARPYFWDVIWSLIVIVATIVIFVLSQTAGTAP